jgi:hypothetical protein
MSRASEAYGELTLAMADTNPACQNDPRFIADDQSADELAPICDTCPLFALCATYGNLERPKARYLGGQALPNQQDKGAVMHSEVRCDRHSPMANPPPCEACKSLTREYAALGISLGRNIYPKEGK